MEKIKLKKGEVSCNKCNGTGNYNTQLVCPKCYGTGKLDWIENVVGKHKNYQLWYAPYIPMVFTREVNGKIERSSNY